MIFLFHMHWYLHSHVKVKYRRSGTSLLWLRNSLEKREWREWPMWLNDTRDLHMGTGNKGSVTVQWPRAKGTRNPFSAQQHHHMKWLGLHSFLSDNHYCHFCFITGCVGDMPGLEALSITCLGHLWIDKNLGKICQ